MTVAEIIALITLAEEIGPPILLLIKSLVDLLGGKNPGQSGPAVVGQIMGYAMVAVQAVADSKFTADPAANNVAKFEEAMLQVQNVCKDINLVVSETDLRTAVQNAYAIFKAGNTPAPSAP